MAVSKVAYGGHTLIDLELDTAVESDVASGKYFHKANGERVQGTAAVPSFPHNLDLSIDVIDGTYQLDLTIAYRVHNANGEVTWTTMVPDEHFEEGYYNWTATLDLAGGSLKDGFFITETNGFEMYSGVSYQYMLISQSGQSRTYYVFVDSNASTMNIIFTP